MPGIASSVVSKEAFAPARKRRDAQSFNHSQKTLVGNFGTSPRGNLLHLAKLLVWWLRNCSYIGKARERPRLFNHFQDSILARSAIDLVTLFDVGTTPQKSAG